MDYVTYFIILTSKPLRCFSTYTKGLTKQPNIETTEYVFTRVKL